MTRWQAFVAALAAGGWTGVANTVVALGVTVGLLSAGQSNALAALISGIATVLNLIVATVHTFQMARQIRVNAGLHAENVALHGRLSALGSTND